MTNPTSSPPALFRIPPPHEVRSHDSVEAMALDREADPNLAAQRRVVVVHGRGGHDNPAEQRYVALNLGFGCPFSRILRLGVHTAQGPKWSSWAVQLIIKEDE